MPHSDIRQIIEASIGHVASADLAAPLLDEYEEIVNRYALGDHRPSELSGGRFSEAAFRICQAVCFGTHTPFSQQLPKTDKLIASLEQIPKNRADETFRIHIPRTLRLIYDLRSKRDVAHLGASAVSPNFADSSLTMACCGWIMAEIVRTAHNCGIDEAQAIVDMLVQRRTPMIWEEGRMKKVLSPAIKRADDKALLLLYHHQSEWIDDDELIGWIEYSNPSSFKRKNLPALHKKSLVFYDGKRAKILPPGSEYVEKSLVIPNRPNSS